MHGTDKRPCFVVDGREMLWVWKGRGAWIAGFPELVVPVDVEVVEIHELFLFDLESALEVAFKRGLRGGPEEEAVAESEVERGDEEAYGLHHVPAQLPEGEPHEAQRLDHHKSQPTVQLATDQGPGFLVDFGLSDLHLLQLFYSRVVRIGYRLRN